MELPTCLLKQVPIQFNKTWCIPFISQTSQVSCNEQPYSLNVCWSHLSPTHPPFRLAPQLGKLIKAAHLFFLKFTPFNPQPPAWTSWPQPQPLHDKNPNHLLLSLLKPLWTGLGPAPRPRTESLCMWVIHLLISSWWLLLLQQNPSQVGEGALSGVTTKQKQNWPKSWSIWLGFLK